METTLYVIQIRYPNLGGEWPHKQWHDRPYSEKTDNLIHAIKECERLWGDNKNCEYRVMKRIEEVVFTPTEK